MLKVSLLQRCWLYIMLTPLTVGVAGAGMIVGNNAVEARPIQSSRCSSAIYGSPIPAPIPVNPVTGQPCAFSSDGSSYQRDRDYTRYRKPIRGTIRDSTLINPTIIDSTISDSVLVDPVIIDTPRSTRRRSQSGRVYIQRSEVIDRSSGIRIRIR